MEKKINIGSMDRKINIYETTETKSSNGEVILTDVLYKSVWANMVDVSSTEQEDNKIYLVQIRNYNIRWDAKILQSGQTMYINEAEGNFFITGIQTNGRKQYLTLKTVKRE